MDPAPHRISTKKLEISQTSPIWLDLTNMQLRLAAAEAVAKWHQGLAVVLGWLKFLLWLLHQWVLATACWNRAIACTHVPWSCQMCMAVSRVTIFLSQHFPHVRQELIIGCACQIPHGQLCGVNQTPRSPRSDKADILADTRIHNRTFAIYIINAIDDNIIRATAQKRK